MNTIEVELQECYQLITSFESYLANLYNQKEELEKEAQKDAIFKDINRFIFEISSLEEKLSKENKEKLLKLFREKIIKYTNLSDFCRYSFEKPRGYSGDFVAMEMIWNGRTNPASHMYLGEGSLGKLLNAYTLESHNCKANEYRVNYFFDKIVNYNSSNIASVGCGSIIEVQQLKKINKDLNDNKFHLFDSDNGAFDFIKNLFPSNNNMLFYQGNILRSIIKTNPVDKFDILYSSGLFDYFDVDKSKKLISYLWNFVKIGGKMIITNASNLNSTKFWMEYVGDWFLEYKTKEDMFEIFSEIKNFDNIKYEIDPFNVYQYATITKNA